MKTNKKKKTSPGSAILIAVCVVMLLYAGYNLMSIYSVYHAGTVEYSGLRKYTSSGSEENASDPASGTYSAGNIADDSEGRLKPPITVDFAALQKINPDIVGWVYIGAVNISYPVVQGKDNSYYLHRTFRKKKNFSGSIFMDAANKADFSDPNTIIYGHNMKNGSMFGKLKWLTAKKRYRRDSYFWILTPEGDYRYKMFSIQKTKPASSVYTLFSDPGNKSVEYAKKMKSASMVKLKSPDFDENSRIVTLSTCTDKSKKRYVVQGVLVEMIGR